MSGRIEFNLDRIQDPYVREMMQRIREEFKSQVLLRANWRFMKMTFTSNLTNFVFPHRLGFTPTDFFQTGKTGTGTIVYNESRFDETNIDVTTAGTNSADPLVVRFFLGRYEEGSIV